jgi:hypothetical protein
MKFQSDIDIDFADRNKILLLLQHTPASIIRENQPLEKHNTGVYFTDVPKDPFTGQSSLDYNAAEERGYVKLDFLNVNIYSQVSSEEHLIDLMQQIPPWERLYEKEFCEQLIHIGNHYDILTKMPNSVDSIEKLAMFLAIIRPAKRHLLGKTWDEVAKTIWEKTNEGYYFKHSHSIAYSHLVVVHMNLLNNSTNQGD